MARHLLMGAQVLAMLRSLKELERYTVNATDGDLGSVANFLFDDEKWAIRYLVVKTGNFFDERRVLVSPISFRKVDWAKGVFHLALTMDQIKGSPGLDCCRARRMRASGDVPIQLFEGRADSSPSLPITDVDWAMSPGLS